MFMNTSECTVIRNKKNIVMDVNKKKFLKKKPSVRVASF